MGEQLYMIDGEEMVIAYSVEGERDLVIMHERNGYGDYIVARRVDLVKKEDSYEYKNAQKRADEIRLITQKAQENLDVVADKVVDKALKELASRIKFNVAFGEGGASGAYALVLSEQLTKMIKEAGEKMKGKSSSEFDL